ncbi:MAG TPA: biopolymer transporter ExbD [Caulobacter sp.]|nr:biopolymer transporter ExbD [Caulobacter sp.]
MGWKRALGLALASVALALVVWGLFLPLSTVSIKVDLPPANAPTAKTPAKPVDVMIKADGSLRVDGSPSSLETLVRDVSDRASSPDKSRQRIMIHAETTVTYATFSAVLKSLRDAGWSNIGWVDDAKAASRR